MCTVDLKDKKMTGVNRKVCWERGERYAAKVIGLCLEPVMAGSLRPLWMAVLCHHNTQTTSSAISMHENFNILSICLAKLVIYYKPQPVLRYHLLVTSKHWLTCYQKGNMAALLVT